MPLTPEEQAELAGLEKKYAPKPALSNMTPDEARELAQLEQKYGQAKQASDVINKEGDTVKSMLVDPVIKAAGYPAGIARTAVGGTLQMLGAPNQVRPEDWQRAKAGEAPGVDEYLARAGVPKGPRPSDIPGISNLYSEHGETALQKGGALDPYLREVGGVVGDTLTDPLMWAGAGTSKLAQAGKGGKMLEVLNRVLNPAETFMEGGGRSLYKSGLNRIDEEARKFGKEPVSDVLMQNNIWGSHKSVHGQMDALGEQLLAERTKILKDATKAGGEVSMVDAMKPAMARIDEIRLSKNPALQPIADAMQSDVNKYLAIQGKPSEPMLRELPVGGEFHPSYSNVEINPRDWKLGDLPLPAGTESKFYNYPKGENAGAGGIYSATGGKRVPVAPEMTIEETPRVIPGQTVPEKYTTKPPQVVYDMTNPVSGPTPLQGSDMKSSIQIPQSGWNVDKSVTNQYVNADKTIKAGLRQATEDSVARSLGVGSAEDLKKLNDDLGRILTTKQKQAMVAAVEERKPLIGEVKAAVTAHNPLLGAAMYGAKFANSGAFRTGTGLALDRTLGPAGAFLEKYAPGQTDAVLRNSLWQQIQNYKDEQ